MIYGELPFLGGGAERAPETFFAKVGMQPGTVAFIGNVHIPGIHPDLCVDLYEGPVKEDARTYVPAEKYDNVISISTIEHVGMGDTFDPGGPKEAIKNIVNWLQPGGFFYVTVPFGKPTPGLERKAGELWAQYYPPLGMTTFMPFTAEYTEELKELYSDRFRFLFLKRTDIAKNRWVWCNEEDVRDCEMLDDGASAIMIITNTDFRWLRLSKYAPQLAAIQLRERLLKPFTAFFSPWLRRLAIVWSELKGQPLRQWPNLLRNLWSKRRLAQKRRHAHRVGREWKG